MGVVGRWEVRVECITFLDDLVGDPSMYDRYGTTEVDQNRRADPSVSNTFTALRQSKTRTGLNLKPTLKLGPTTCRPRELERMSGVTSRRCFSRKGGIGDRRLEREVERTEDTVLGRL